jgi:hypothetical protein
VLSTQVDSGRYESAINNIYSIGEPPHGIPSTARLYTSFNDVTFTGNSPLSFPQTLFQRTENALGGWTLVEEVFICGNGNLYCDDYINPTGKPVASFSFTGGALGNQWIDASGIPAPGNPFT